MQTSDFDYDLPVERIAQTPVEPRDSSRLMVVDRAGQTIEHRIFREIGDYLEAGDVLVANDSRVLAARLHGRKTSGARVELLLLRQNADGAWYALAGGKKMRPGTIIEIFDRAQRPSGVQATIVEQLAGAQRLVSFSEPILPALEQLGETPLPPYISERLDDPERYQTVYARPPGSAAAPTAGLHFTPELLLSLREKGVLLETVTLHVGLDTFQPVKTERVADHTIHSEWIEVTPQTAERINRAKLAGGRIVAIGTTSMRVLETAAWRAVGEYGSLRNVSALDNPPACPWKPVVAVSGSTDLFIYPGYDFRAVDVLITNFHLPQSSLLMLVSAFAGQQLMRRAYQTAIDNGYRFFSFGDAMLII